MAHADETDATSADVSTTPVKKIIEDINSRYDDFFRFQKHIADRLQALEVGKDERKRREAAHAVEMEQAREAFVKTRRERPSDEHLQLKWEAEQKERAAKIELLRRRYVERRDYLEDYTKKGRQIPEMKEYDLQDY